ncbi:MAG: hypothetical protein EB150_04530 [Nitrososphaeria archaeon]|nr:hypothetical protein [Nitrososphaeria archaeon]NDF29462.1 hypothetical protein [Nitrososphaeria archaeon]
MRRIIQNEAIAIVPTPRPIVNGCAGFIWVSPTPSRIITTAIMFCLLTIEKQDNSKLIKLPSYLCKKELKI